MDKIKEGRMRTRWKDLLFFAAIVLTLAPVACAVDMVDIYGN